MTAHSSAPNEIRLPPARHEVALDNAFQQRSSCRDFATTRLDEREIAGVLTGARHGDDGWAYPSAHDLRPVELTVLLASGDGGSRTTYAYDAARHVLRPLDRTVAQPLSTIAFEEQPWLDTAPMVIALEADLAPITNEFADQDPVGLRGRDFVMIEAGALAQNLLLGAAAAGLGSVLVAGIRQQPCLDLLGTSRHVCGLIAVGHPSS